MLVYKESLPLDMGMLEVLLPFNDGKEARENILHVGLQRGRPNMWFNVKREKSKTFVIIAIGTGHGWGEKLKREEYIGTALVAGDNLVWHYFLLSDKEFKERFDDEEDGQSE